MTKKSNILMNFIYSFSIFIVTSLLTTYVGSIIKNKIFGYILGYLIAILLLYIIYRKKIKFDFKNFKDDFKKYGLNIFIVSSILIASEVALSLLFKHFGINSANQSYGIDLINENKIMILYCVLLSPVFEELCFRLPYHYSTSNKILTYIVYSCIFAFTHLMGITDLISLVYAIPYLLLAFGVGYGFYKSDNILMSTMIHIINNSLAIMLILI